MNANISQKTSLTGAGGALATVIIFIADTFGYEMDPGIAAAIVTIITVALAYFLPAKSGKYVAKARNDEMELTEQEWEDFIGYASGDEGDEDDEDVSEPRHRAED